MSAVKAAYGLASRVRSLFRNEGPISAFDSIWRYLRYDCRPARALRAAAYRAKYRSAAPRAAELIRVDPSAVEYLLTPLFQSQISPHASASTFVLGGDWDTNVTDEELVYFNRVEDRFDELSLVRFERYVFYRSLREHFENGRPWEETRFYRWLRDGDRTAELEYYDETDPKSRLRQIDDLYAAMESDGYRTQRELSGREGVPIGTDAGPRPELHEVMVNVGRDGEIIFEDGRHRFCCAKILGLDEIPVRVLVRHERWQEVRSEVAGATRPSELSSTAKANLDHPDIRPVLAGKAWGDRARADV